MSKADWGGMEDLFSHAEMEVKTAEEQRAEAATATLTGKTITKQMRLEAARQLFERDQRRAFLARGADADQVYRRVEKYYLATVDFIIEKLFGESEEEGESGAGPT